MSSLADHVLARPLLVRGLQTSVIVGLGATAGIATCLHVWMIPAIQQAQTTRTKLEQFRTLITLGLRYLMPSNRLTGVLLASMAWMFSRSEDPTVQSRWRYYAAAMAVVVPAAPFEIFAIFPTNDRLFEMEDDLNREGKDDFGDQRDRQVDTLLSSWRRWHTGRVVIPLTATIILAWSATA